MSAPSEVVLLQMYLTFINQIISNKTTNFNYFSCFKLYLKQMSAHRRCCDFAEKSQSNPKLPNKTLSYIMIVPLFTFCFAGFIF